MLAAGPADPVRAVLFDFHTTLVDGGDPQQWLAAALVRGGAAPRNRTAAESFLHNVWEHASEVDPDARRDLSPAAHRQVFHDVVASARAAEGVDIDEELAEHLYDAMPAQWHPYADAVPVLTALRDAGVATALISNVGIDIRDLLAELGLLPLFDAVVLSCDLGVVKPDARIFQAALDALGLGAHQALMVGDSPTADGGAAALGIRTLILPRTTGPVHGLAWVCRLVGVPYAD